MDINSMTNPQLDNSITSLMVNPLSFKIGDFFCYYILGLPHYVTKETLHFRMETLKEIKKKDIENEEISDQDKQVQITLNNLIFANAENELKVQLQKEGRLIDNKF